MLLTVALASIALSQSGLTQPAEGLAMQVMVPLERGLGYLAAPLASGLGGITRLFDLQKENQQLREEVLRLTQEVVRLREAELENRRLQELLWLRDKNPDLRFVGARVIGADSSNLIQSLLIDKGSADGVEKGMAVVAAEGLVGRVSQVYANSARVLLITDPSSSVSAMIQPSHALGMVRGRPGSRLAMEYLSEGRNVAAGDLVLTSGLGGNFPKGLLIGQVKSIRRNDVELFQELSLEPAVAFRQLEEVMVVVGNQPLPED